MRQRTHRYNVHHIQDELLKMLAQNHLRQIASYIYEAGYFALQDDEVINSSNQEQVVLSIRWVMQNFRHMKASSIQYRTLSTTSPQKTRIYFDGLKTSHALF